MLEYTPTPDMYDYICHYGVKGMKWGVRKSAMRNDPRYRAKRIVKTEDQKLRLGIVAGRERERLNRLNKPVTTTSTSALSSVSDSSSKSKSKSKSKKGGSSKAVKDILDRFKLTKGGKGSSKAAAAKKTGSGKSAAEKKESTGRSAAAERKSAASSSSSAARSQTTNTTKKETLTDAQKKQIEENMKRHQELLDKTKKRIDDEAEYKARKRKDQLRKKWVHSTGYKKLYPRS